jgi:hypothetical protein
MRFISAVCRGIAVLTLVAVLVAPAASAEDMKIQPPIPAASTSAKVQPPIGLAKIAYLVLATRFGLPILPMM